MGNWNSGTWQHFVCSKETERIGKILSSLFPYCIQNDVTSQRCSLSIGFKKFRPILLIGLLFLLIRENTSIWVMSSVTSENDWIPKFLPILKFLFLRTLFFKVGLIVYVTKLEHFHTPITQYKSCQNQGFAALLLDCVSCSTQCICIVNHIVQIKVMTFNH